VKLGFPSHEFDEAVAAVCHGPASDKQMRALNDLLRSNDKARDEYILRVEIHSRLASKPNLFVRAHVDDVSSDKIASFPLRSRPHRARNWIFAIAACMAILGCGWWAFDFSHSRERAGATSRAVAMLNQAVDARWNSSGESPRVGAPIEPGQLRLESGLAQVVFYSGARIVIEAPAQLHVVSSGRAVCLQGRMIAEVPPEAHGFQVETPTAVVTDLGTSFGLDVKDRRTELHVFKGSVDLETAAVRTNQNLLAGSGAVLEGSLRPRRIAANPNAFAALFELQSKSSAAGALRFKQWQEAGERLNGDPSLLLRFDFQEANPSSWHLRDVCKSTPTQSAGTIIGCQWSEGRWPQKRALEFQSVSDRVRLSVPGEFESLTLAAWVRVQGLDRQLNSLFMCDGYNSGSIHWLIRQDGSLGLTVKAAAPNNYQILVSPPVLTLNRFGLWTHLAAVIDGRTKQVVHYVNGVAVSTESFKPDPPFRIGAAELGNWNVKGASDKNPNLIRNFSGAMDEFCLFNRPLTEQEIRALYDEGKPQSDPQTLTSKFHDP
jgi:hypothetical protein